MTLLFALMLAADHYRDGGYTDGYAAQRIAEIRELARKYGECSFSINVMIPPQAPEYEIASDEYLP